jgi:hypothetical protein
LGAYEFRATAYDAAGNVSASSQRSNGVRMILMNPLKMPVRLQTSRRTVKAVPYGREIPYSGRLTSASGPPLGGLPVQIVERFDAGAALSQRSSTVLTDAGGNFATRLPAGPSRRVEAVFAGNRTLTRAGGGDVRVLVAAAVRLHASAPTAQIGGAPVLFSGRVGNLGAPVPAGGEPVELQFRLPGRAWAEFRTVQTDAHGRFRYPYAFSDDDSRGVRFMFRAYISRGDWPYEPAASNSVSVTGTSYRRAAN